MRKAGTVNWGASATGQGSPIAPGATPGATAATLQQMDREALNLLTTPYCSPALVYDASSGNRRYWVHAVGYALRYARLWCGIPVESMVPAVQQTVQASTQEGGESGADIITHPMPTAFTPPSSGLYTFTTQVSDYTGQVVNDAPVSSMDRQLQLPETLDAATSQTRCSAQNAWSVSIMPTQQSDDLEAL